MLAKWLIIVGSLLHLTIYLYAAPEHAIDPTWPSHAKFHIVQAIFWIAGLDLTAAIIGYFCLPSSEKWPKYVLGTILVTSHFGYFISMLFIPDGRPPEMSAHIALGGTLAIFFAGFVQMVRK